MIGFQFPSQKLQPFTKKFGQPLHDISPSNGLNEIDGIGYDERNYSENDPQKTKEVSFEVEKVLDDFTYDSDGDDSLASLEEPDDENDVDRQSPSNEVSEPVDLFLSEHSDILPPDTPEDTVNTLKALKHHIETSENRSFTNLERQLLATIVQHGIFNSQNDTNPDHDVKVAEKVKTNRKKEKKDAKLKKKKKALAVPTDTPDSSASNIVTPPPSQNIVQELVQRKALLPTPGSIDEVVQVVMEDKQPASIAKPMLKLDEQKKLHRAVETMKGKKRITQESSYHPDDQPTLELLESFNQKNDGEPAYEDLLNSFKSIKKTAQPVEEPKYRSKTKILQPPASFLSQREKMNKHVHSRRDPMHREEKESRRETKRRVKVEYKVDRDVRPDETARVMETTRLKDESSRKRKMSPPSKVASNDNSKSEAVDLLANLITQKIINQVSESSAASQKAASQGTNQHKNSNQSKIVPQIPMKPFNGFQTPQFMLSTPVLPPPPMLPITSSSASSTRPNLVTIVDHGTKPVDTIEKPVTCSRSQTKPAEAIPMLEDNESDAIPLKAPIVGMPNSIDYIDLKNPDKDSVTQKDLNKNVHVEDMVIENQ